jgi:lysozyme
MAIPDAALDLIKSFEGYLKPLNDGTGRVKPYLCPASVATIGWGNTRYPNGQRVKMGDPPIDRETATRYLAHELTEDEAAVDRLTPGVVWHPLMRGAIVSFTYNCGSGAFKASTLRKKILAREWDDVPRELRKYRMGGGRVLPGLVRRRDTEAAMFMRGVAELRAGRVATAPVLTQSHTPTTAQVPQERKESIWTRGLRYVFGGGRGNR